MYCKKTQILFSVLLAGIFAVYGCASHKNSAAKTGDPAPAISGNSPSGQTISLSDLKGKIVLIDFWASWCAPCRKANPDMVKLYEKYKDKSFKDADGFTILSVSLDEKADAWKAAIAKDNLYWPYHVSDLKGWQSDIAKAYGVNSIPFDFIVDANGNIIAKNLQGEELALFLNKLLR